MATVDTPERLYTSSLVECRSANGSKAIFGYAATFNTLSRRLHFGFEMVDPAMFNESRSHGFPDVICRAEHSDQLLLGAVHSGTLTLAVDSRGLAYECALTDARQDVYESVGRKDYGGSSFTFKATDETWEFRDGAPLRILRSGTLRDVGPVTVPAYSSSSVALRSLARHMDAPFEDVAALAEKDELRQLFTRSSDGGAPAKTLSGAHAMAHTEARRGPKSVAIEQDYLRSILQLHAQRMSWH
jgi:HK97 family phage prohead protease